MPDVSEVPVPPPYLDGPYDVAAIGRRMEDMRVRLGLTMKLMAKHLRSEHESHWHKKAYTDGSSFSVEDISCAVEVFRRRTGCLLTGFPFIPDQFVALLDQKLDGKPLETAIAELKAKGMVRSETKPRKKPRPREAPPSPAKPGKRRTGEG